MLIICRAKKEIYFDEEEEKNELMVIRFDRWSVIKVQEGSQVFYIDISRASFGKTRRYLKGCESIGFYRSY